ncbi:hypothetical protein BamIOP4010DRAFT_2227 [Burkholderia ambifaria IOP40-10]|uniref:Uncharacterized protein n=1 Tax=Burkholderia ambifaria IOP40-10 TaxID=396596 RepID=B1FDW8_9BURK|nr:hypothetical protein [Burkholderia ambifaria]EDT04258.1 hypothetical protein BamIOP4010DRAFT_2227 [Burkholderia ambifaria IOP40-10]
MANVKSASKPAGGAQVLNLADFRKNQKATRKPSAEETVRNHYRVFGMLADHIIACAELLSTLDEPGGRDNAGRR